MCKLSCIFNVETHLKMLVNTKKYIRIASNQTPIVKCLIIEEKASYIFSIWVVLGYNHKRGGNVKLTDQELFYETFLMTRGSAPGSITLA